MKLFEMRQQRDTIARQMRSLNDEKGDKAWTQDDEKRWGDMTLELGQLDAAIKRAEQLEQIASDEAEQRMSDPAHKEGDELSREDRCARALDGLLRRGWSGLSSEDRAVFNELRAAPTGNNVTTADKGGYTVPKEFRNRVVDVMKQYGGLANIATVLNTDSGAPITWVITDGTAEEGVMLGETEPAGEGDLTFGQVLLGAKKMTSKYVLVSNELLNDSGIDIVGLIARRLGQRIGRGEAKQLITGDGTGNNVKGLLAQITGTVDSAAAAALAYGDMLALKHSVDPAYRANAQWLFNDATLLALKQLKDGQQRPLWLPDIAGVTPATFDGDGYTIDQAMPSIAASAKAVAYGDFSAFQIRRVNYMQLKRLDEKFADNDQTAFLMFHRFDCVLEDVAAVKALAQKSA